MGLSGEEGKSLDTPASDRSSDPLAAQVSSGLRWSLTNQLILRLGTFGSGIVLARILDPLDFGVFTIALAAMNVLFSVNDLGLMTVIIRWQGDVRENLSTAWGLVLLTSLLLCGATVLAAPLFAQLVGVPEVALVLRVLSLILIIDAVGATHAAMIGRRFRQDLRAVADVSGLLVTLVVTIALALRGQGYWSLVWGRLVGNIVISMLMIVTSKLRISPRVRAVQVREMVRLGSPFAGAALVNYMVVNIDYLIIGGLLGARAVGFYLLAFNLASWPVNLLSAAIERVSIPTFSTMLSRPDRLKTRFHAWLTLVLLVGLPITAGQIALTTPLISVVYGRKWLPSSAPFLFLALLSGVRVFIQFASDLLVAMGRGRSTLGVRLVWLGFLVPALAVGASRFGLRGAGVAHVAIAVFVAVPAILLALRSSGIRPLGTLRSLVVPASAALALYLVTSLLARHILIPAGPILALIAGGLAYGIVAIVGFLAIPLFESRRWPARGGLAGTGDWSGALVICGNANWDGNHLGSQSLASHLSRWVPVLYVDPPMSVLTGLRRPTLQSALEEQPLRLLSPTLARLTPQVLPGMDRALMRNLTTLLLRRSMSRSVAVLGCDVEALIVTVPNYDVLGSCHEKTNVWRAGDDFSAGAELMGRARSPIERGERSLARKSDLVIAVSERLRSKWEATGVPTVLIPNGCEVSRSTNYPIEDIHLTGQMAGYIGHLSLRLDLELLEMIAEIGHPLLLVGPRQTTLSLRRLGALLSHPNVQWLGPQPFAAVSSYVRRMSVGLVPYSDTAFNRASFPLKTLEYLAQGIPVVMTDVPELTDDMREVVDVVATREEFLDVVAARLASPGDELAASRRIEVARANSWERRAREYLEAIEGAQRSRREM